MSVEQMAELDTALAEAIGKWREKHHFWPEWFVVDERTVQHHKPAE